MRRDQAIRKVIEPDAGYDYAHALVDSLVALGLLHLDGPVDARGRALTALFKQFGAHDIEKMFGLLEEAGLAVVDIGSRKDTPND